MLVVLEGQGEVNWRASAHDDRCGRTAYVPPKTRHNVFNTGTGPLKYIFIVSKALE